jgi:hypothetical protein
MAVGFRYCVLLASGPMKKPVWMTPPEEMSPEDRERLRNKASIFDDLFSVENFIAFVFGTGIALLILRLIGG